MVLNFLLQLGFREAGSAFALATLDDAQRAISADMSQLGLLMPFRCVFGMYLPACLPVTTHASAYAKQR